MTQDQIQEGIVNKAVEFYKTEKRGHINGAMRLGKIKISLDILKKLYSYDCTVLIAYPDNKIQSSWEKDCIEWGYSNPNITYVNFSSLWKYETKIFDFFIIDEFHSASPKEREICHIIMTNDENMKTLALSGTISKETNEEWGLKEIAKYTTEEGIRDGILANYQITVHLVDLDNVIKTPNKAGKLLTEKQKYDNISYVIEAHKRQGKNNMFLALARNRFSISSIGKLNYLRSLLKKMKDKRTLVFTGLSKVADEIGIPSYHNKSASNANFLAFQAEKINQLALAAMGKMGVTYPNLDSVILLNFTYNPEESSQILNRAIKLDYKGKVADLHILCLKEKPELKKIKESLSMLDQTKIKYV